ncbi:MAG: hypothetical protein IJB26_06220 [Clostridia bacterium]|nr:hypothetical protein [Clostridia bacterium]
MAKNKKNSTKISSDVELNEELGIFGRSQSREEIKAQRKEQRAREIQALRDARRAERAARKADRKAGRKDTLIMLGIALSVIAICGVVVGVQIARENNNAVYDPSETNTAHFYDLEALPSLEEDGISCVVNEVFYTKGDYLCVNMTLGNGTEDTRKLDSLSVKISNGDTGELIASGYTEAIDETYRVGAQQYNTYTMYIKPEHVKVKDATLEKLTYEIEVVGTAVEE